MKRHLALFFGFALSCTALAEDPSDVPEPLRPSGLLDEFTLKKLAEALACVNLSVADLGWNKRPIDDDFRLRCVNETLDMPLTLADRAERAEREFGSDPEDAVRKGATWLDIPAEKLAEMQDEKFGLDLSKAPEPARDIFFAAVRGWHGAEKRRGAAMEVLSAEERELVRKNGARLYADESEEEWDMTATLAAAKKADVAAMFRSAQVLAALAAELREKAKGLDPKDFETVEWTLEGVKGAYPELEGLKLALGGPGPDRHTADIVIDVGGDDVYEGCRLALDLGGDDTYRNCAVGLFSSALVVDLAGNDRYINGNFGQGGAAFGASILLDVAGDDRYEADQLSHGSGFFGVGMLFDLAGNDGYRGARFVQGFGGVRGLGILSDVAGNDTYYAGGKYSHAPLLPENFQSLSQGFGFGLRGANTSGGVGILADHAGNDIYSAEVFGQGASYWFSLGVLVDSAGHDKYDLYQYGQGSGIHLSSGVLFDRAGNDCYSCNYGVAQGCGHDWAAGLLLDFAGDDYYQGSGMTHGGANANGLGILIDRRGNDSYSATHPQSQGFSFQSRGTFGLGLMLDLGGQDKYTEGGGNNSIWTKSTLGVGLDAEEKK